MARAVTDANLDAFEAWILNRNRGEGTAESYKSQVRLSASSGRVSLARLARSSSLAPNTKWQILAALKAWARWTKDDELKETLEDLRLPPAKRVAKKSPLTEKQWRDLIAHLREAEKVNDVHRVVIVIMALRGLRLGDVLRIEHHEVKSALSTRTLSAVAKGGKRREFSAVPIMADLKVLTKYPVWERIRDLVGPASATEKALGHRVRRTLKRHAAKVGIPSTHPHQLRRTFATQYLESMAGDPAALIKLQKYMDWSDLSTAARYVDAVDAVELNAAADRMVKGM